MGKLIIMGTNAPATPGNGAPAIGSVLPVGYLEDVFKVARIFETLEGLRQLTAGLKTATASHAEDIKQLTHQVYAIPHIKKDVAKNTKDLNMLGKRLNGLGASHTKVMNDLGTALRREIGDLRSKVDTGENIFRLFLGALVVAIPIVWAIVSHHVSLSFH